MPALSEALLHRPPRRFRDAAGILLLTVAAFACSGFHPLSEDGGLYAAGVEWLLNPRLFPQNQAIVTAHLHYSVFAPLVAWTVRRAGCSVSAVLLLLNLGGIALELYAGLRLARRLFRSAAASWAAVALLAAWWTIPVAGTSLLLNDPYATARTFSTPLSLLALAFAIETERRRLRWLRAGAALALAAAFHPLMAGYAALLIVCVSLEVPALVSTRRRRAGWMALCTLAVALCLGLQLHAASEAPPTVAAATSRYYWFLSRWQWYEWMGLADPLAILWAALHWRPREAGPDLVPVLRGAIGCGVLASSVALLFAQEHLAVHAVARLQPLRSFLLLYALLALTAGGWVGAVVSREGPPRRTRLVGLAAAFAALGAVFFAVQRAAFAPSAHIEWPGAYPRNPWAQAFQWAREHTPPDAYFALDARYVNEDGEGALVFRALAQRDQLPDFSKDGGEAAITPALADRWLRGADASLGLSEVDDAERERRLRPLGVTWLVLHSSAVTTLPCPYRNPAVKICRL